MNRPILAAFALILPVLAAASGSADGRIPAGDRTLVVSETNDTVTCRDADGGTVTLKKRPLRAVVNYTSFVGPWYFAGGAAVGIPETAEADRLPEAARLAASTGRSTAPNIERVLALEPDLVIVSDTIEKQRSLREIARGAGIPTLSVRYETYADYLGILDLFFRLNGRGLSDEPDAAALGARVDATVERARSLGSPRFLSLFVSARSVQAETDAAHTAYMASLLGGVNAAGKTARAEGQSRIALSPERIVMEDPDLILVTPMGDPEALRKKIETEYFAVEPWRSMKAVRNGRVAYLPPDLFLYKPNERFPEAFAFLADLLHPGKGFK